MTETSLTEFEQTYRDHVAKVQAGDMKGVMADMAPDSVPEVFQGVTVPTSPVSAADIRDIRIDGDRGVGECVYTTADGAIGLRSGWAHDGTAWKADRLDNFDV